MATAAEARTLQNFVGGSFVDAAADATLEDRDPATGELAARVPLSGAADVDAAVRAARQAQPAWRQVPPQDRARHVLALRDALVGHRDEITALVTADMGKTLADANGEVGRGIESVESAAAIPHLLKGETLEGVASGIDVEMIRQPVGVVAAITPFNFPAMIPLWFLPYAVACGNSFVLKPSERDPRPTQRICELIAEEEIFPPGVVNLVHGGREAVESLLDHDEVDAVSFVGQASTARLIATRSAETGKRVQALGGAKNSMIVAADADLSASIPAIMGSAFGAAGQRCLAGSVCVIVGDESRQAEVRAHLKNAAEELITGAGADPETDVCPMVTPEARERAEAAVAAAEEWRLRGAARRPDGGRRRRRDPRADAGRGDGPRVGAGAGGDLRPGAGAGRASPTSTPRSSSPTAPATATPARSSPPRRSVARAYRWGIEAGMLGVNIGVPAPVAWFPFSGWKDSIDGDLHANGKDAVDFYTRKKVVTARW